MDDLPTYNAMPPLSPPHKPTPTITQMADKHERDTFADEAMGWLHWATCWIGGALITAFVVSLFFRLVVGVY
jgi:hypothetical protein